MKLLSDPHPNTASQLDEREEIFALIRMIEYVRSNLKSADDDLVDQHLQAAVDALSVKVSPKN